mgnify:CR=1 FL=1
MPESLPREPAAGDRFVLRAGTPADAATLARIRDLPFIETNRLAKLVPDDINISLDDALKKSNELRAFGEYRTRSLVLEAWDRLAPRPFPSVHDSPSPPPVMFMSQELDRFAEAQFHFRKAIESNPKYAEAHYDYGLALAQREQFRQAEEQFAAAVQADPNLAEAHNALGEMASIRGDAGRALEAAGFTQVYHVEHGFEGDLGENHHRNEINGWRHDGLPWEQS